MDEEMINLLGQVALDSELTTQAKPWSTSLAMHPKKGSPSSDGQVKILTRDSSEIPSSPSTPTLLSQNDDSEVSSELDEPLEKWPPVTKFPVNYTIHDLIWSYGSPCEDPADDLIPMFFQTDGSCDDARALPLSLQNELLTKSVPSHDVLVAQRRLKRHQHDQGIDDFAYLRVPVPKGIVSAVYDPSPSSCLLIRRSSDGFIAAMSMFKAAFPRATVKLLVSEREHIKSIPATKPGSVAGNFYIHPDEALILADEYCIRPYILALLDPTEIPQPPNRSDGSFGPILAPPRYPPADIDPQPTPPASVDHAAISIPGDGTPIARDGKLAPRLFDPQSSTKHQGVPDHLLTFYHPGNKVRYLRGTNPVTKMLEPDMSSLVITIDGVMYNKPGGETPEGAGIVYFHNTCVWSNLAYLKRRDHRTRQQALLEGLNQALLMVKTLMAADPLLREVRIMTSDLVLCELFAVGLDRMDDEDTQFVQEWLKKTDMTLWKAIEQCWRDIEAGEAGRRVDVRLWFVGSNEVQPATEMAIAEMYRLDGRDWYQENEKGHDPFKTTDSSDTAFSTSSYIGNADLTIDAENTVRPYLDHTAFIPPKSILDQGHEAVAKWDAETRAMSKQALLYKTVAAQGICTITNTTRAKARRGLTSVEYWEAHSKAMGLDRALRVAEAYLDRFEAEHALNYPVGDGQGYQGGESMNVDEAGDDLVQNVMQMVMADEGVEPEVNQMECD